MLTNGPVNSLPINHGTYPSIPDEASWRLLPKLLKSLHRAFDRSAHSVAAMRIQHSAGVFWRVRNRTLWVTTEAGAPIGTWDLETLTLGELYSQLQTAGCIGVYFNTELEYLQAVILLDGENSQSNSNGDLLTAYNTLLWDMLDAMAYELEKASVNITEAVKQIDYATSEGEFVDIWGEYWGIARNPSETDTAYIARTVNQLIMPKVNPLTMAKAATELAGETITIYEPWRDTVFLGDSTLGDKHLADCEYWDTCLFQAQTDGLINVPWAELVAYLNTVKPTAVIQMKPYVESTRRHIIRDSDQYSGIGFGRFAMLGERHLGETRQSMFNITIEDV